MVLGKSIYHVNQDEGKCYSKQKIEGYYNNLTEKVSKCQDQKGSVPKTIMDTGEEILFSIAIFQYGLGAYDLYLMNDEASMLENSLVCADWAVDNQQEDGSWITFDFINKTEPYSSMAQGEGISLLLRACLAKNDQKYFIAAERAKSFMLRSIEEGGTTKYDGDKVFFYETTFSPLVLNGWIFSYWGLWDYYLFTKNDDFKVLCNKCVDTLCRMLEEFDAKYWSYYDLGGKFCSPFYHRLHIAQLKVMYDLTERREFNDISEKWERESRNILYKGRAFIKKAIQKIRE
jgi:hypothetical protein